MKNSQIAISTSGKEQTMWEQARIWFYQMMAHLDPISLGFYVLFFFAVIGTMLLVDGRIKFVPNDRWRFGDKLK